MTAKGKTALSDKSSVIKLPVPESVREAERLEKARREKVMAQLQERGVQLDKLPEQEVEAGDGEVIRAFSKWTSYVDTLRKNGKEERAMQLEKLLQAIETWRAETAIKQRMAPSTVLAEHTLLKIAYATVTMPPGMKLSESDLMAAGVRTREIGTLCEVLRRWVEENQPMARDNRDADDAVTEKNAHCMQLEPGKLVKGVKAWEYAVYKPNKKTGLASWESSYNRFSEGESPQAIAISPSNGRPIQVKTVCGHIMQALLYGKAVDLHRLAEFAPPPTANEWEQMQAAEQSAGVDVSGDPVSSGGGGKVAKVDLLRPILGDAIVDLPFDQRSEDDKSKLGHWYDCLEWYMTLKRIGYEPTFASSC